jgi:hypothetical protein
MCMAGVIDKSLINMTLNRHKRVVLEGFAESTSVLRETPDKEHGA